MVLFIKIIQTTFSSDIAHMGKHVRAENGTDQLNVPASTILLGVSQGR